MYLFALYTDGMCMCTKWWRGLEIFYEISWSKNRETVSELVRAFQTSRTTWVRYGKAQLSFLSFPTQLLRFCFSPAEADRSLCWVKNRTVNILTILGILTNSECHIANHWKYSLWSVIAELQNIYQSVRVNEVFFSNKWYKHINKYFSTKYIA